MNARHEVVRKISELAPPAPAEDYSKRPLTELYGENVFGMAVMRGVLPKKTYQALVRTVEQGEALDASHADTIATAMKDWAISRGATHYTHWFQPMTGLTAEKHDTFLNYNEEGRAITEFSGKMLIKGEPDASSFPSGGIRATFEARGYTAWDPTSPAFLMEGVRGKTLVIPTAFCSWTGEALDKKTPLLRSLEALNKQALRVLRILGNTHAKRVTSTVGPEQEYFLVDRRFYWLRPDLINAGRTLFGARPPKGQEMEDHYFGSIRPRVLAFMMDLEHEAYRLGIPIKTRHNEVSPAQFEVAPIFERGNVAADHNMLLMELMRGTAQKHGFECLLHEKPFAGVNGSGKHNNWSMMDDQGNNLLEPGQTPEENAQFLVFMSAVVRSIHKWGHVLRASIASAANDHRLGANEAPPAIISVYLGERLTEVVQSLVAGTKGQKKAGGVIDIGVSALPPIPKDESDRNRTSPFAFTGNKFEFRAVGASMSIARPNTYLNTIAADSLDFMATEIEKAMKSGKDLHAAVQKVVSETLGDSQRIIFNGDNYTKEWHAEAEKRGIPNLRHTVDAVEVLAQPETKELFRRHGVYSEQELASRRTIFLETYVKTLHIESSITANMAQTILLPAVFGYQRGLALTLRDVRSTLAPNAAGATAKLLQQVTELADRLQGSIAKLEAARAEVEGNGDVAAHARHYREKVLPAMEAVREAADALELLVDDEWWPLPKYREMLFVY
ncbi:MAG: glutamine synthetase III [Planctomycetes bacterium]|nr:glutamine synthetase III [Planctomycetota bacterium]